VHNFSHDPENPEAFLIQNTASTHYANIHGSTVEGCFLGPFSTVDFTTLHDCVIGAFAYLQAGELSHQMIEPGRIWIRSENEFDFRYQFPREILKKYIHFAAGKQPKGLFMDFAEERKEGFQRIFDVVHLKPYGPVAHGSALNRYAVVKGKTRIGKNVLIAQRAFLENAWLGKGANVQENCYIIDSRLNGNNVTAHGGKIIHGQLGEKVFVGFNAFLRGNQDCPLSIGKGSIIMPHTIIDLETPLNIPPAHLVWGHIRNSKDLKKHSRSLKSFSQIKGKLGVGSMRFKGSGLRFVKAFQHRIEHILEANGAYFDGKKNRGHAQKDQDISFNTIQPYPKGRLKGLYPSIEIRP
jgi:carbonic anhydrase/acetyltransferase-like protein (isoleucine patch superfamily)